MHNTLHAFHVVLYSLTQIYYNDTRIQLLDLPGIIEGAAYGRGRGREVSWTKKKKSTEQIFPTVCLRLPVFPKRERIIHPRSSVPVEHVFEPDGRRGTRIVVVAYHVALVGMMTVVSSGQKELITSSV